MIVKRREAEFMKFAVNGMLALRLGYINELANLADLLNIDIDTITADGQRSTYRQALPGSWLRFRWGSLQQIHSNHGPVTENQP